MIEKCENCGEQVQMIDMHEILLIMTGVEPIDAPGPKPYECIQNEGAPEGAWSVTLEPHTPKKCSLYRAMRGNGSQMLAEAPFREIDIPADGRPAAIDE